MNIEFEQLNIDWNAFFSILRTALSSVLQETTICFLSESDYIFSQNH